LRVRRAVVGSARGVRPSSERMFRIARRPLRRVRPRRSVSRWARPRLSVRGPARAVSLSAEGHFPRRKRRRDLPHSRSTRQRTRHRAPLVYFVATRPGWYRPIYPCYVVEDDPAGRRVLVSPGRMVGAPDDQEPALVEDPIERRYAVRETRVRLHQARFRARVIAAYSDRCAICHLKELRLLDAAHIVGDLEHKGEAVVTNGLSLCSMHHRTFDQHLVGVSPDYTVHVSAQLLEDEDGPMLDLLKTFHTQSIVLPARSAWKPDRERLAVRFERFLALST
jgi:putative restriction endonuclease